MSTCASSRSRNWRRISAAAAYCSAVVAGVILLKIVCSAICISVRACGQGGLDPAVYAIALFLRSRIHAAESQDERQENQDERGYGDRPPKGQRDEPPNRKHDQRPPVNDLRQDDDKDGNTYCPAQFQDRIVCPEIPRRAG